MNKNIVALTLTKQSKTESLKKAQHDKIKNIAGSI
jgi:hypothetical protein